MVFKPLNLARQSFIKTFTHGYAQSLVAASQSSSASQNTSFHTLGTNVASLFAKSGVVPQSHNDLQASAASAGASVKASHSDTSSTEGGLAAYYAAWQRHRKTEDKELHQFQFAKRIGWKAPTTIPDGQARSRDGAKRPATSSGPRRPTLTRSNTTSALDQLKASVEQEPVTKLSLDRDSQPPTTPTVVANSVPVQLYENNASTPEATNSVGSTASYDLEQGSLLTRATSVSLSDPFTDHLTALAEDHQYGEIPAVFESILASGSTPTASAYNALLLAAINLPRGKHLVVSKVLDVYADMLRRKVTPDTSTYAILIELLAARAMDVNAMKQELLGKLTRFGNSANKGFLLQSDETEAQILAEDDALSIAIKLFDISAAVATNHTFAAETYRLLIAACAEAGRLGDMVRIYASLESQGVTAPSAVFAPMISAFAATGDLRSAVECYEVYKALAIADNDGIGNIVRKDDEIYAAVVRAYMTCGRTDGALQFLDRILGSTNDPALSATFKDAIYSRSIYPVWIQDNRHGDIISHAQDHLTSTGKAQALALACSDAADKNLTEVALNAFKLAAQADDEVNLSESAMSIIALHARQGKIPPVEVWAALKHQPPTAAAIEATTLYALSLLKSDRAEEAISEAGAMFNRIREGQTLSDANDRIDEAIEVLGLSFLSNASVPSIATCMQLLRAMADNGRAVTPITECLLAFIGPDQVSSLPMADVKLLAQAEASLLVASSLDVAHAARFAHLMDIVIANGVLFEPHATKLIQQALLQLHRPDLVSRWQTTQLSPQNSVLLPVEFPPSPAYTNSSVAYEDTYDPYSSSTDFKGSSFIADELEKPHASHAHHLQEALFRFRNMRRLGRHPRYAVYAKLIGAAARENQLSTAEEILAMAKQDVPLVLHSAIVRSGWSMILDAMVAAALTTGRRDIAGRYHQDLINMGAAPSANTFGLYITTLKEGTKTFDEATEAVKIFHQAKAEGVEPTSFLYNALIGKLGKARRIDDTLFYFAEMRARGIRPTSVTYGTVVNALCRVSDDKFAEQLFEEMESCANYKPRPAPYNSLMQYFLTTKRDRTKVLVYYERMCQNNIEPTMHTYKLLIDTYATLSPADLPAAERVIDEIKAKGMRPEAVHYAALIHAKGCVLHDMPAARALFDSVLVNNRVRIQPCLYQALFESYVANRAVAETEPLLSEMKKQGVHMTAYIANTLIHGWATTGEIQKAKAVYEKLGREGREPSTYEAMTRAWLSAGESGEAKRIVGEALRRGYPGAVSGRIAELVAPQSEVAAVL